MTNFKQRQLVVHLKKLLPKLAIVEVLILTSAVGMAATSLFIGESPGLDAVNNLILAVILATVIFFTTPFYLYAWPPRTLFVRLCVVIVLVEVVASYIIAFAIIYRMLGIVVVKDGEAVYDAATCLYFSMITWTTSGYGEVIPSHEARFWAASEALLAYVVMVGSIAILGLLYRSMFDEGDGEQT
jgi:hypothetical protein